VLPDPVLPEGEPSGQRAIQSEIETLTMFLINFLGDSKTGAPERFCPEDSESFDSEVLGGENAAGAALAGVAIFGGMI
jgi:hypothetical protein